MDYWDDMRALISYTSKRYSPPNIAWSKRKFETRCCEIHTCDLVIAEFMDNPFRDTNDILEEYLIYIEGSLLLIKKDNQSFKDFECMKCVIMILLNKNIQRRNN